MPLISLQSVDDPRLEPYRDLRGKQTARQLGLFVAEGHWLVQRLLSSSTRVHSILTEAQHLHLLDHLLNHPLNECSSEIDVLVAPNDSLNDVVGFHFHRGILACGYRPEPLPWRSVALRDGPLRIVICDRVCDPENLGGVIRNASALGVDAVVVGPGCGDVFSRRVARVSMGTFLDIPIDIVTDLAAAISSMQREHQIDVFATVLDESAEAIWDVKPTDRVALVFGNEGHGIDVELSRACSRRVTLPMRGGTDSMNVSSSVAVFLYHFSRTR
jgi:tRNA G18 (ribose-2'-O)-methylase SpoU